MRGTFSPGILPVASPLNNLSACRGSTHASCSFKRIPTRANNVSKDFDDFDKVPRAKLHMALEDKSTEEIQPDTEQWQRYKIPHRFVGFNPMRLDIQRFPAMRTDFDGQSSKLWWHGTECTKCGLQVRREKRTNRETSLNLYAHDSIPEEMLRSCPETKKFPLLWRTRDPFKILDVLGVEDNF